ncbi:hypothetical protein DICSQDRAFT_172070 [Dichomitus squalens LYAD-421 SS1]|uniref:RNase III domain-containing protein n=2 Tax=Dichomitus squalens TaxID=114155 RepID=A0A4Q9M9A4_9APHY|nr:uncharacterized protein DICSQDRAFT_172070 [Dichomitus squalens LYAD-421 SS1]EJF59476.1 hypothetical protein DICSQDRAFT_172070 [Dichomitus squalens LYAD-421 SS1]TBU23675.1 hypothetical protein BD311DRAFT_673404 [Dichomitus squalens]
MAAESLLPPAPQIDGEAMLQIFVHSSVRFHDAPLDANTPYGDGKRLAFIGGRALEAAYALISSNKHPLPTAEALEEEVSKLQEQVEKWVEGYKWREMVRHANDVDLRTPEETRYLMDAYVGAVLVGSGFQAVLNWIATLVDPSRAAELVATVPRSPDRRRFA